VDPIRLTFLATPAGIQAGVSDRTSAPTVWWEKPEDELAFHRGFLSDPPLKVPDALALARRQAARARLDAAMHEPWIDEFIEANVADWIAHSGETKQFRKLLIRDKRILDGRPSGEADFIRVMEQEPGLALESVLAPQLPTTRFLVASSTASQSR